MSIGIYIIYMYSSTAVESFLLYSGGLTIYLNANLRTESRSPNEAGRDIGVEYFRSNMKLRPKGNDTNKLTTGS